MESRLKPARLSALFFFAAFLPHAPGLAQPLKLELADPSAFATRREELWVREGIAYAGRGDRSKASELFDRALKENPASLASDLEGQMHEAAARKRVSDWDRRRRLEGAFKPGDPMPPLDEAAVAKEERSALEDYAAAVRAHPSIPALQRRLGLAYLRFGDDPAQASEHLVRAVELNPSGTKDRVLWIDAAIAGQAFDPALEEIERLREEKKVSRRQDALWTGRIEFDRKNFLKSISTLRRSKDPLAQYYIAKACEAVPRRASAVKAWRRFVRRFRPETLSDVRRIAEAMQSLERLQNPEEDR